MRDKQATIYDVAEAAGVSIATVSRVVSGGSASKKSKEKVLEAISRLSYHPNQSARALDMSETRVFGLVVTNLNNPYYTALCAGAEEECAKRGYSLQVYCTSGGRRNVMKRMLEQRIDGLVFVGGFIEDTEESLSPSDEAFNMLDALKEFPGNMPMVVIGSPIEGLNCMVISSDLELSIKKSISHLIALGHKRIAFIGGNPSIHSTSRREATFIEEMERRGLPTLSDSRTEFGFTSQAGELCVSKLFSRVSPGERPTALIAINDLVALGALHQLDRMGLRVPEDVALIGCDNSFFTPFLNPPLTTVDLHPYDHGKIAVSELAAICGGSEPLAFTQVRECSLIVRESCGAGLGPRNFGD